MKWEALPVARGDAEHLVNGIIEVAADPGRLPAAKLGQRDLRASVRFQGEIGSSISLRDHRCLLVTCVQMPRTDEG